MRFSLIPRLKPYLSYKELLAALKFSKGNIPRFEKEFAEKFECRYGIMFQHGRSGLYSLFKIWGLKNAEIICPAYTCVVVPHAIVLSGNIPVFVDCVEGSPNMDYNGIEKAITKNTRVVIVSHIFGYPMDVYRVDKIVQEAEKKYGNKIYIVQDAAHSFGARWNGELVAKFGDAAIFGLNISKTITSIFGGMVTTNNKDIYNKLQEYRKNNFRKKVVIKYFKRLAYLIAVSFAFNKYVYAFVNFMENLHLLDIFVKYYEDDKIYFPSDWNECPSEIEAKVGLIQLAKYDEIIESRIGNAKKWIENLKNAEGISFFYEINGSTYSHCAGIVECRDNWVKLYKKKCVQLGILIEYSIPYMPAYKKYAKGKYSVAKYYSEHLINFPVWAGCKVKKYSDEN